MKPERWQQVDKLLEQALEQQPDRRGAFLDGACQGDAALRREVESLLSAHWKADDFIEAGPLEAAAGRASAGAAQSLTGRQVGHYQILSRLGEGGMGVVYKARDQHLDRFVAIKVLPPELVADPDRKRRFVQEAKAASALNHPNIITVHDIASDSGTDFIVMEYVQGKTLGQLIPRRGLKLNDGLKYAIQIADALANAHAAGIVHRDLKPGNIMVGEGGLVKVLDFGLAKLTERPHVVEADTEDTQQPQTEQGMILGTTSYMSPEQAAGKPVDARSDIFSFGSVLYEMVTGQRAFQGDSKMSTLAAILNQEPKSAREIARILPGWELSPSFSPDGKQVAFTQADTGRGHFESYVRQNVDIYIKQIGVEEAFRLTDHPAPDLNPAWSPDGQSIAFARQLSPERVAYIAKPQRGGPERTIAEFTGPAGAASLPLFLDISPKCTWTTDSKGLVVVGMSAEQLGTLFLVLLETGEKRPLMDPPTGMGDTDPALSPDGRALVFSRIDPTSRCDLWLLSLSKDLAPLGKPERLTFDNPINRNPVWTPRGREIVYASGTNWFSNRRLFKLQPSRAAKPERLAVAGESVGHPAISSQGNRLAYEVGRADQNIWRVEIPGSGSKPKAAVKFISSTRSETEPRFSPDGKKISFASTRSGSPEIWICNHDGSQAFPLTSFAFGGLTNRPRWAPDGRRIVFYSDARGNRDIYVIHAEGGGLSQLTKDPSEDTNPGWSADGKWIYFQSNRSSRKQIWKVSVAGGDAVPVGEIGESSPVESPDGKLLYFDKGWPDTYSIWRIPTSDGAETRFIDLVHPTGGWVVMDDGIYYISRPNEKGISYIRFKDFATDSDRVIASIEGRVSWGLTVSPDRRTFLYTLLDEAGSDLMLVENFR